MVWNMFYNFPDLGNFIIPTDELILFRGVQTTSDSWLDFNPAADLRTRLRLTKGNGAAENHPIWVKI